MLGAYTRTAQRAAPPRGTGLRQQLVLLIISMHVLAASAACAFVDRSQSNGWLGRDGAKRFSIKLNVVHWVAFTQITLT